MCRLVFYQMVIVDDQDQFIRIGSEVIDQGGEYKFMRGLFCGPKQALELA